MRKLFLIPVLLVLLTPALAEETEERGLNVSVQQECESGFEPLISLHEPNATYNNVGAPGLFQYQVCVDGLTEVTYQTEDCPTEPGFYISDNSTNGHFSEVEGYNLRVCTGNVITNVREACHEGETALFKVSRSIEGFGRHVASPLFEGFDRVVCGRFTDPDIVTLDANFNLSTDDDVYFDGEEIEGEFEYSALADFPYLVSTDGENVAGIVADDFERVERKIPDKNRLRFRRDAQDATFIFLFTEGDQRIVERSQGDVLSLEILSQLNPSFANFDLSSQHIRAVLRPDAQISSNLSIGPGSHRILLEKIDEDTIRIERE